MAVTMVGRGVQGVDSFARIWRSILDRVGESKGRDVIGSSLSRGQVKDLLDAIPTIFPNATSAEMKKSTQYPVIEIAARDIFNQFLASTNITESRFVRLWNLLDITAILSDDEQCDPALLFWLVEELLDSQPIAGCRKVFDYLESRRERITAKHFAQKNLIILRTCNELLRRLSRAEDTAFCGRVFIFLFQSFPLGDKSSVNLRGEYHIENVTTWDESKVQTSETEMMDVDAQENSKSIPPKTEETSISVKNNSSLNTGPSPLSPDALYPIFWALQKSFNQPKRLFDPANFSSFKTGLEATMAKFKSLQTQSPKVSSNRPADEIRRGAKRKGGSDDDDLANAFNPKYLTSRDLFELEISDMSFQRYVLIQVLIVMDFLLSLSRKAKEKLASATLANSNKSVMYADMTVTWANEMKKSAADYLRQDPFFYRMVETVLSRDKNWARWKIENCPSIARPPITPEEYVAAKVAAKKATQNKRLRPTPIGSLDLKFLAESNIHSGLENLKNPSRYDVPSVKSFEGKIELDDMDIDMAMDDDKKRAALESKSSKSWRALRLASSSKLVVFDKLERSDNISQIFRDDVKLDESVANGEEDALEVEDVALPTDRRPIAIAGPSGSSKQKLIETFLSRHGRIFANIVSHTTRAAREEEVDGQHYHFVTKEAFNMLRDADELLEYNTFHDDDFGTSRKNVQGIIATGKIPMMEMEMHGIQQLKENSFTARNVFVPPFENSSDEDESMNQDTRKKEVEYSKLDGSFDMVLDATDLEGCLAQLETFLIGDQAPDTDANAGPAQRSSGIVVVGPETADTLDAKVEPELIALDLSSKAMDIDAAS